jgi:hypothetical protein
MRKNKINSEYNTIKSYILLLVLICDKKTSKQILSNRVIERKQYVFHIGKT